MDEFFSLKPKGFVLERCKTYYYDFVDIPNKEYLQRTYTFEKLVKLFLLIHCFC